MRRFEHPRRVCLIADAHGHPVLRAVAAGLIAGAAGFPAAIFTVAAFTGLPGLVAAFRMHETVPLSSSAGAQPFAWLAKAAISAEQPYEIYPTPPR